MTIMVTGGSGFIGSNFVIEWLDKHNEAIVNLDKLTYAGNPENLASLRKNPNYIFFQEDIANTSVVDKLLKDHNPRFIVNFAAESHVDRSIHFPENFIKTNIVGTFQLLESTRNYWNKLGGEEKTNLRFLHVSTDEVYGSLELNAPSFSETHRYKPNSPYSASKAASDHLVRAY